MILDKIAKSTLERVKKAKENLPLEQIKAMIFSEKGRKEFNNREPFAFEKALKRVNSSIDGLIDIDAHTGDKSGRIAFICEVKKASPSKGIIAEDFPYLQIAKDYEAAGANAISVLTEPEFFKGDNSYLSEISKAVHIPVLRKDFTIDEYQIYEAKIIGADAVLLICSLLNTDRISSYIKICDELGLSALVEAHTVEEIYSAIQAGARIIGVNNRNLQTFEVNLNNSVFLRGLVPKEILFVAESGIKTQQDMKVLKDAGVNAVLIGETLMRSPDKKEQLQKLKV